MRLPITPQLSTKDGAANKNARLTNALREKNKAVVRPGLLPVLDYAGDGQGLVPFNGRLIALFGDTVYDAVDFGDGGSGDTGADLTTVAGTAVHFGYQPWDSGLTYPLGWQVTYSGTTYTSTVNGNLGVTPGSSASWSPYVAPGSYMLTAVASGSLCGYKDLHNGSDAVGAIDPGSFHGALISVLYSTDWPDFTFEIIGLFAQTELTSITVDGVTLLSVNADSYAQISPGITFPTGATAWSWNTSSQIVATPGTYSVTIT